MMYLPLVFNTMSRSTAVKAATVAVNLYVGYHSAEDIYKAYRSGRNWIEHKISQSNARRAAKAHATEQAAYQGAREGAAASAM